MLAIVEQHSRIDLQEEVFHRMALIFKEISETEEFLDYIDYSQLLELLQRNDLTAPSETFVFKAVIKWIYHDKEERLGPVGHIYRNCETGASKYRGVDIRAEERGNGNSRVLEDVA